MQLGFHSCRRGARQAALLACSALIALAVSAPAQAQAADEQVGVQDIVVTAQRREQLLQDVPIAISAISRESLEANRITNVQDLSGFAPNLSMRETAGGVGIPNFSMRGAVSYGSVAGQDKAISLYLDGVYIGSSQGSAFELPDLERIEVLRGPQGTLFGRNATAGAISIITREPSGELGIRSTFTYGNYDHVRISTRIETPQVGPFSASISYTHSERDGDIRNLGAGTVWQRPGATSDPRVSGRSNVSPERLGDQNTESVFAALKFEPSDTFKLVYRFDWMNNNFTPEGNAAVALSPFFAGATAGAILTAAVADNPGFVLADEHRPKAVNNAFTVPGYQRVSGHNLTGTLTLNDRLSLKAILAQRKSYIYGVSEIGGLGGFEVGPNLAATLETIAGFPAGSFASLIGSPFVVAASQSQARAKQWSGELQANYSSDFVDLTVGGIYFDLDTVTGAFDGLPGSVILSPVPGGVLPTGQRNLSFNKAKSYAGYVQAEFHVTPQIDVVAGYRLTRDEKTGTSYVYVPAAGADPARQDVFPFVYEDTRSSYLLGVNYKPRDGMLLYAKYSTGFVSGGSVSAIDFPAETVKAWEAGVKADLFDRLLRANLALFKADYRNLQAVSGGSFLTPPQPTLGTLVIREGNMDTKGVELELSSVPVRGLTLGASVGYTDVKFSDTNPLIRPPGSFPTLRPKWTGNAMVQYETEPLFGEATAQFRLDATYRSKVRTISQTFFPASYDPVIYSDAMWKVNARASLRNIDIGGSKAEVSLWARNLFDADNPAFPITYFFMASATYERARTYGVDVTFEF